MAHLSEGDCRRIAGRVLEASRADEVEVGITSSRDVHVRFARNAPTTDGDVASHEVVVRSTFGTRTGEARGNQLDDLSLQALARRSEEVAKLAPEDPEFVPALGPQDYAVVDAWSEESSEEARERLVQGVGGALNRATEAGLVLAGFARSRSTSQALATSAGLFAYHREREARLTETARTPDGAGSGWGSRAARVVRELDFDGATTAALEKARSARAPRPLEPGSYPAVLEPACVASLVGLFLGATRARVADEGRSFFSAPGGGTRLGETLFGPEISIRSDPAHPSVPTRPWNARGLPRRRCEWVREGALENLSYDRYWAREKGHAPLARPGNTVMDGGDGSVEDLVRSTERGVLVTSLWYIRSVDPRTLLYTGLTRDGVFWIEDGRVSHPVNNFRWNESPVEVLKNTVGLSRPVRVAPRARGPSDDLVPALQVSAFGFSSVSEAV